MRMVVLMLVVVMAMGDQKGGDWLDGVVILIVVIMMFKSSLAHL